MTPSHRDYAPEALLHVELCQEPRRYEATMSDGQVLVLPSVTAILDGKSSGEWEGNEATRIGTTFHAYAAEWERFQAGMMARLAGEDERVRNAWGLWAKWRGALSALPGCAALVEVPVCSIRYGFAGTLDLLLTWPPDHCQVHDHKTSQELSSRDELQVVAYGMALEEMLEAGTAPGSLMPYGAPTFASVGRFGKSCREPEVRRIPRADWGPLWARFLAKLEARAVPA